LHERLVSFLINGDDLLFTGPPELGKVHAATGEEVGLKQTVGKSYMHPRYANINSLSLDCKMGSNNPRAIPFFNVGLFFGQNKVLGEVDPREPNGLASAHDNDVPKEFTPYMNKMIAGMLEDQRAKFLAIFLKNMKVGINRETKSYLKYILKDKKITKVHQRNIFLPEALGGMGVSRPKGFHTKTTLDDKRVASIMLMTKGSVTTQRPLPGPGPDPPIQPIDPWDVTSTKPKSLVFKTAQDLEKPKIGNLSKLGSALSYFPAGDVINNDVFFGMYEEWDDLLLG
jgi:hypothetical protein